MTDNLFAQQWQSLVQLDLATVQHSPLPPDQYLTLLPCYFRFPLDCLLPCCLRSYYVQTRWCLHACRYTGFDLPFLALPCTCWNSPRDIFTLPVKPFCTLWALKHVPCLRHATRTCHWNAQGVVELRGYARLCRKKRHGLAWQAGTEMTTHMFLWPFELARILSFTKAYGKCYSKKVFFCSKELEWLFEVVPIHHDARSSALQWTTHVELRNPWIAQALYNPRIVRAKRGSMLCAAQSTDCHRSLVCAQHKYEIVVQRKAETICQWDRVDSSSKHWSYCPVENKRSTKIDSKRGESYRCIKIFTCTHIRVHELS